MKENFVKDYFIHAAKLHGLYVYRSSVVLNSDGETFFIKFLKEGRELSKSEKIKQKEIKSRKGKYVIIRNILDCTEFFAINK